MPHLLPRLPLLCVALSLFWAPCALAQHEHSSGEFEVFLAAEAFHGTGQTGRSDADPWVGADVVFGATEHQFRVFGELYVTTDEVDLERFQMGFEFVPETVLWIGRFHQPASAWNTEHHHGQYLQTAITRPFIERWEDEQGLIPQHITGAFLESRQSIGASSAIQLSAGVGAAPTLTSDELDPIDLIGRNPGKDRLSVTGRVAFLPEYVGASSAGLLFGHDVLNVTSPSAVAALNSNSVDLSVSGAFVDWNEDPWRVIGTDYYVEVTLNQVRRSESFNTWYLQIERQLPRRFTIFGRVEDSARMQYSRYVALFDDHEGAVDHDGDIDVALRRQALGLRWDFTRRQALTLELSHIVSLAQRSNEVRVQWSAVIP
jgi:hypothetical protein